MNYYEGKIYAGNERINHVEMTSKRKKLIKWTKETVMTKPKREFEAKKH